MAEARKKKTSTAKKKTTGAVRTSRKSTSQKRPQQNTDFLRAEVVIICSFAVALLLFLSNLGLCGVAGGFLRNVQLGLFGMIGYLFPILLALGTSFYMTNAKNVRELKKLAAAIGVAVIACALMQLFFGAAPENGNLLGYFTLSAQSGRGGGLIGGILGGGIAAVLGTMGACVILIVLLILALVFITERSFVSLVRMGSDKAYHYAKSDMERRHDAYQQRRAQRRLEAQNRAVENDYEDEYDSDGYDEYDSDYEEAADEPEYVEWPRRAGRMDQTMDLMNREILPDIRISSENLTAAVKNEVRWQKENAGTRSRRKMIQEKLDQAKKAMTDEAEKEPATREPSIIKEEMIKEPIKESESVVPKAQIPPMPSADEFHGKIQVPPEYESEEKVALRVPRDRRVFREMETENPTEQMKEIWRAGRAVMGPAGRPLQSVFARAEEAQDESDAPWENVSQTPMPSTAKEPDEPVWEEPQKEPQEEPVTTRWNAQKREEPKERAVPEPEPTFSSEPAWEEPDPVFAQPDIFRQEETPAPKAPTSQVRCITTASGRVIETEVEDVVKKPERKPEPVQVVEEPIVPVITEEPKKKYVFPSTELLKRATHAPGTFSEEEYRETAIKLQQTLRNFGVGVTVTNISCGPAVTRYELLPEQGVKVNRIKSLADDIKLNLAAADIRIEAPIPGKAAVGIEVPNKESNLVYLRELLESDNFKNHKSRLAFAVGKDIGGQVVVADIAKMPHLLIAGATGSGKSVCINTLIMSVIYKADPEDVKLIMVDPKVVELSVYNGIPHLLIPVVTDPKKASGALNWAVAEMEDRYKKFAACNVRDLKGYNERVEKVADPDAPDAPKKLPQIVIIIDELADLMMVAPGEVEGAICRLAQLARAAGIHLVIATQRPSVNVITGLIKANVPSRIAFAVSSGVDSRTIIDMNGAEKLLGRGDMLFYPAGLPKPQRVQGAFVSDEEVGQVVEFLANQGLTASYSPDVESRIASPTADAGVKGGGDGRDEYFVQAGQLIIDKDKASIGMLQRMFKIGFNRAARIMDQLAEAGVVGAEEGTKPRTVLMSPEEFEEFLEQGH